MEYLQNSDDNDRNSTASIVWNDTVVVHNMKGFSFFNCASCKNSRNHSKKKNASQTIAGSSDPSVNESNPSSAGNYSAFNKDMRNGSAKENLFIVNANQLTSSHSRLDAKSVSLTNESIDASKINLLPSDSCSILMKQSVDRISNSDHSDIYKRLDAVVRRLEHLLDITLVSDDHSGIIMFNGILNENMSYYVDVCSSIGGPALEQAKLVREAFQLCLNIMQLSRKYAKPSANEMSKIMQPLSFKLYEIAEVANRNKSHILYQPLLTISDSVSILSWINMSCSAVFVKDVENATKVSANITTQMYRESTPLYAEWMRAWLRVVGSLRELVCDFYPVGIIWQAAGAAQAPRAPEPISAPIHVEVNSDGASLASNNSSRREWKRQDGGKAFNRDALLTDIMRTRLAHLKHVEGFSYES
uniref:Adenylyl cyclase associated protein n=1 Tax=Echinococcus granulosus TaxID=6210 RepID=A0A068WVV9_ECHGR|nr:adenylyl cyclase associated protein [Echinococcus granulosus]